MNQVFCDPKIKPEHLARKAIVYLRQSSEKQVRQNKESPCVQHERGGTLGSGRIRYTAGSRPSPACARPSIAAGSELVGCSPSQRRPTTWFSCGISRPQLPERGLKVSPSRFKRLRRTETLV
jgi:hypothetical protein